MKRFSFSQSFWKYPSHRFSVSSIDKSHRGILAKPQSHSTSLAFIFKAKMSLELMKLGLARILQFRIRAANRRVFFLLINEEIVVSTLCLVKPVFTISSTINVVSQCFSCL